MTERHRFFRIIGHQLERANVEEPKNFYRERIITQVHRMSKSKIGFDCVEPLILQLIGAEFFHQADAATLLMLIDEHSCALLRDCAQRQMKLLIDNRTAGSGRPLPSCIGNECEPAEGICGYPPESRPAPFRRLSFCMLVGIGTFKGQQVESLPSGLGGSHLRFASASST